MALKIIAAVTMNRVIGAGNRIPFRLPDDMKRFRDITIGKPVVMGRKTYWSLPSKFRPLPDRENIVITRNATYLGDHVKAIGDFTIIVERSKREDIFVIGGSEIYALALPYVDEMFLTRVQAVLKGEVFFPPWDSSYWRLCFQEWVSTNGRNQYRFAWEVWRRA